MRILLVNSPNEVSLDKKNANYSLFPHIGIVQLATRLKLSLGNRIEVEVFDGGIASLSEVEEKILCYQPNLVGISVLTPTYAQGLKIAQISKSINAITVLGDEHAIFFSEIILENRPEIDFIIVNDVAEQPFLELISALLDNRPLDSVDSLVFRQNNQIKTNAKKRYWLHEQNTRPDLSFIQSSLATYAHKYAEAFGNLHKRPMNVVTINNARGCENGRKRCSYCSIADLTVNVGAPEHFWQTIESYHEEYNINLFFEVYDSFTASPTYISKLLSAMPTKIKQKIDHGEIELMVYARALGLIQKGRIDQLKRLGVRRVNIGLDSGDEKMLLAQRKNKTTDETNLLALTMLKDAHMTIHGSYIFGAPGETVKSMQKTYDHIQDTIERVPFSTLEASKLYPLANSPIWDMMLNYDNPIFYSNSLEIDRDLAALGISISDKIKKELVDKYAHKDLICLEDIRADWYNHFTHVAEVEVENIVTKVDNLLEKNRIKTGKNIG